MRLPLLLLSLLPLNFALVIPPSQDHALVTRDQPTRRCDWTDAILGNVFRRQTACVEDIDVQNGKVWTPGEAYQAATGQSEDIEDRAQADTLHLEARGRDSDHTDGNIVIGSRSMPGSPEAKRCGNPCYQKIGQAATDTIAEDNIVIGSRSLEEARGMDSNLVSGQDGIVIGSRATKKTPDIWIWTRSMPGEDTSDGASTDGTRVTRDVTAREPSMKWGVYPGAEETDMQRANRRGHIAADSNDLDSTTDSVRITRDSVRITGEAEEDEPRNIDYTDGNERGLHIPYHDAEERSNDESTVSNNAPDGTRVTRRCTGGCYQDVPHGQDTRRGDPNPHPDVIHRDIINEPVLEERYRDTEDYDVTPDGTGVTRRCSGNCYQGIPDAQTDGTRVTRRANSIDLVNRDDDVDRRRWRGQAKSEPATTHGHIDGGRRSWQGEASAVVVTTYGHIDGGRRSWQGQAASKAATTNGHIDGGRRGWQGDAQIADNANGHISGSKREWAGAVSSLPITDMDGDKREWTGAPSSDPDNDVQTSANYQGDARRRRREWTGAPSSYPDHDIQTNGGYQGDAREGRREWTGAPSSFPGVNDGVDPDYPRREIQERLQDKRDEQDGIVGIDNVHMYSHATPNAGYEGDARSLQGARGDEDSTQDGYHENRRASWAGDAAGVEVLGIGSRLQGRAGINENGDGLELRDTHWGMASADEDTPNDDTHWKKDNDWHSPAETHGNGNPWHCRSGDDVEVSPDGHGNPWHGRSGGDVEVSPEGHGNPWFGRSELGKRPWDSHRVAPSLGEDGDATPQGNPWHGRADLDKRPVTDSGAPSDGNGEASTNSRFWVNEALDDRSGGDVGTSPSAHPWHDRAELSKRPWETSSIGDADDDHPEQSDKTWEWRSRNIKLSDENEERADLAAKGGPLAGGDATTDGHGWIGRGFITVDSAEVSPEGHPWIDRGVEGETIADRSTDWTIVSEDTTDNRDFRLRSTGMERSPSPDDPATAPTRWLERRDPQNSKPSYSAYEGSDLVCRPFGECEPCPADDLNQPFCMPFGNRRLLHCIPASEADIGEGGQTSAEIPAWEACGKVVSQERHDFLEFVCANLLLLIVALAILWVRSSALAKAQYRQLATRIGFPGSAWRS